MSPIPRLVRELLSKAEADLGLDHPGLADSIYRAGLTRGVDGWMDTAMPVIIREIRNSRMVLSGHVTQKRLTRYDRENRKATTAVRFGFIRRDSRPRVSSRMQGHSPRTSSSRSTSTSRRSSTATRSRSSSSDDGPEPPPATAGLITAALQDALARVAAAREAIGDGDTEYAASLLYDLEIDIAGALS